MGRDGVRNNWRLFGLCDLMSTTKTLRPYQTKLDADVNAAWLSGAQNVIMRLDTGGGKSVIIASIIDRALQAPGGFACVIAHRHELVAQLSFALACNGVYHNIIASEKTIATICKRHARKLGRVFYNRSAPCVVASVDTLVRAEGIQAWAPRVTLWIVDEGHHLVEDNKWHSAISRFTAPGVRGLLPTATPGRADGKGLGRPSLGGSGVADVMVEGPPMRWLIEQGFLTPYKVFCPPSDLQVIGDVASSGDWSPVQLRAASKNSHIVGNVVREYQKYGAGTLGVTFATDIETAAEMTAAYNAAGIPAECLTGKTEDGYRAAILDRFEARDIMQIVAVDIISEGFDLPAIETVSFARPTQSLALYMQQFGRALRPMPGKPFARVIDHAGNLVRHQGAPDKPRPWSLANRDRRSKSSGIPIRVCLGCYQPFESFRVTCPHCGERIPAPEARGGPEHVSGDLYELSEEALKVLRGEVLDVDMSPGEYGSNALARGMPPIGAVAAQKRFTVDQDAQRRLRQVMGNFGFSRQMRGLTDAEMQREFYLLFGMDVLTAQGLKASEAVALADKIVGNL